MCAIVPSTVTRSLSSSTPVPSSLTANPIGVEPIAVDPVLEVGAALLAMGAAEKAAKAASGASRIGGLSERPAGSSLSGAPLTGPSPD